MMEYGGLAAPTGWLLCDGSEVSRATYADLFTAVSTRFGAGNGSTTFNLPDFRGRVPVGYAASGGHSDVATIGNNEGSAAANRRPKHGHTDDLTLPNHGHSVTDPGHTHYQLVTGLNPSGDAGVYGSSSEGGSQVTGPANVANTTGISVGNPTTNPSIDGTVGVSGTASDTPAYLVVNKIIKT
jgi:microcystin-dependent protein